MDQAGVRGVRRRRARSTPGLLELVKNGTAPGYPDVYNTAFADVYNNFIVPKMVQRVVIDGWDVDRAMDEAQTQAQAIYDKYK